MTASGFDGRARLASGSARTPSAITYRVEVAAGALRLGPAGTDGVVLDVPLARVSTRPLGRGGSVLVDVDESPLLLDFADHPRPPDGAGATEKARHLVGAARGRRRRDRFLRAIRGGRP